MWPNLSCDYYHFRIVILQGWYERGCANIDLDNACIGRQYFMQAQSMRVQEAVGALMAFGLQHVAWHLPAVVVTEVSGWRM